MRTVNGYNRPGYSYIDLEYIALGCPCSIENRFIFNKAISMEDWIFDSTALPKGNESVPLRVNVRLYIHELSELNSLDATFHADFYLVFTWDGSETSGEGVKKAWWPKFDLMNAKTSEVRYASLELQDGKTWQYTIRVVGQFKILGMAKRLKNFPFDSQNLVVDMSFWDTTDKIALIVDEEQQKGNSYSNVELFISYYKKDDSTAIDLSKFIDLPEWEERETEVSIRTFSHQYQTDIFGRHPRLQWDFPVRRLHEYYFFKILSVAVVCNLICGFAFFAPISNLSTRVSISVTMFLALVAFQFVVMESLPKTSERTRVDRFFVASYLFAAFVLVVSIMLVFLELPAIVNWICLGLYVLCNVWEIVYLLRQGKNRGSKAWKPGHEPLEDREAVARFFNPLFDPPSPNLKSYEDGDKRIIRLIDESPNQG